MKVFYISRILEMKMKRIRRESKLVKQMLERGGNYETQT